MKKALKDRIQDMYDEFYENYNQQQTPSCRHCEYYGEFDNYVKHMNDSDLAEALELSEDEIEKIPSIRANIDNVAEQFYLNLVKSNMDAVTRMNREVFKASLTGANQPH